MSAAPVGAAAGLLLAAMLAWPSLRAAPSRGRPRVFALPRCVALRRARVDRQAALVQVLEAVAAQVRGGAVPTVAWDAAVDLFGEPADHLPRARGQPLAEALRQVVGADRVVMSVAAAWALAEDVGAPLADVLEQLATGLRHEADVDAEVAASLAAPRATARLLAALPLAGVGLGELIGADPVRVLLTTPVGRLSAVAGVALAIVGQLWTRRLVAGALAKR